MYLACDICGAVGAPGVCAKCAHIAERYRNLERAKHRAESVAFDAREQIQSLFREIGPQYAAAGAEVAVPRYLLERLLCVVSETEEQRREFVTDNLLVSLIVLDAADFIRASGTDLQPKVAASLLKHLRAYNARQGWPADTFRPGARICRNVLD